MTPWMKMKTAITSLGMSFRRTCRKEFSCSIARPILFPFPLDGALPHSEPRARGSQCSRSLRLFHLPPDPGTFGHDHLAGGTHLVLHHLPEEELHQFPRLCQALEQAVRANPFHGEAAFFLEPGKEERKAYAGGMRGALPGAQRFDEDCGA